MHPLAFSIFTVNKVVKGNRPRMLQQHICWQLYWGVAPFTRIYGLSNLGSGEKFQNPHLILCAIQMPFFLVLRNNVAILKPEVFPLKTQNKWSCLHFGTCFHFLMRTSCIPSRYWLSLTFCSSLHIIKTQLEGLGKNICSD